MEPQHPCHDGKGDSTWRTLVGSQAVPHPLCSLALDSRAAWQELDHVGRSHPVWPARKRSLQALPLVGRDPLRGVPSLVQDVNAAADTRQGQRRWGHPQGRGMPLPQARWKEQHLEQIPLTEICPRSKIISENPNGLSLATHQTATCVRNV